MPSAHYPSWLSTVRELGADATIRLDQPEQNLTQAFARAAGDAGFNVIIDYLWGRPTEALLAAITRADLRHSAARTRLVQVGESAGPTISLPAAVPRSSGLEIVGAGSGSVPPRDVMLDAYNQLMARAASGALRVDTERVPLAEIEAAWQRADPTRRRLVIIP